MHREIIKALKDTYKEDIQVGVCVSYKQDVHLNIYYKNMLVYILEKNQNKETLKKIQEAIDYIKEIR